MNNGNQEAAKVEAMRAAVADYMYSEGCSCCQDIEAHKRHTQRLAELLGVEKYDDGSGYNFAQYRTKKSDGAA